MMRSLAGVTTVVRYLQIGEIGSSLFTVTEPNYSDKAHSIDEDTVCK